MLQALIGGAVILATTFAFWFGVPGQPIDTTEDIVVTESPNMSGESLVYDYDNSGSVGEVLGVQTTSIKPLPDRIARDVVREPVQYVVEKSVIATTTASSPTLGLGLTKRNGAIRCRDASSEKFGCISQNDFDNFSDKLDSDALEVSSDLALMLEDESGSGALVFGTAPTIQSLTLLGLSSALLAVDEDGMVGATTTITLDGLTVAGSATTTFSNGVDLTSGCFAVQGTCITSGGGGSGTVNSGTTGQVAYFASNGVAVSGSSALTISGSSVGVGTTSPYQELSVAGDLALTGALYDSTASPGTSGYILQTTSTGVQWVATSSLGLSGGAGSGTVNSGTTGQLAFYESSGSAVVGTSSVVISTLGNVGVGSTSPYAKFSITNSANTQPSFLVEDTASPDPTPFVIDSNGRVGIGSSSPTAELVISSTNPSFLVDDSDPGGSQIEFVASGANTYIRSGESASDASARFRVVRTGTTNTNVLNFDIYADTTYLNGLLAIGTTTPQSDLHIHDGSGSSILTISGSDSARRGIDFNLSSGASAWQLGMDANEDFVIQELRSGSDDFRIQNTSGSDLFLIESATGNIAIGTSTLGGTLRVSDTSSATGALFVSSSQSAPGGGANLATFQTYNPSWDRPLLRVMSSSTGGNAADLRIDSPNPDIEFVESDQVAPSGKFEIAAQGNRLQVNSRTGADVGFETILEFAQRAQTSVDALTLYMDSSSATRNAIKIINATSSAGAQPGIAWRNEPGTVDTARISSASGASNVNAKLFFEVADSAKTLQTRMMIDNTGRVGIGSTTPMSLLSVAGDIAATGTLSIFNTGTSTFVGSLQAAGLRLTGNLYDVNNSKGTTGMVLQATGSGVEWVATSTLGFTSGALTSSDIDTSSELAALLTDETGTAGSLVFSVSPTFTGTAQFANASSSNLSAVSVVASSYNATTSSGYLINGTTLATGSTTLNNYYFGGATTSSSNLGTNNLAFGSGALYYGLTSSGQYNFAAGRDALRGSSTALSLGFRNTAIGFSALAANYSGSSNNALGYRALTANTTGSHNNAFGEDALFSNTVGLYNTALGYQTLWSNTIGSHNTAIGYQSLVQNSYGGNNTAIGAQTLYSNSGGSNNIAIGQNAGYSVTTGSSNVLIGQNSAFSDTITTGSGNIGIGTHVFFPSATANRQLNIGNLIYGTLPATSTAFTYPTSGAIGIGSTSPNALLSIHSHNSAMGDLFAIGSSTSGAATSSYFLVKSNGRIGIGTTSPTSLFAINTNGLGLVPAFTIGSSTRSLFTVLANGNVGIGSTSPIANFSVAGNISLNNQSAFMIDGASVLRTGTSSLSNTLVGIGAGAAITTGNQNTAFGRFALYTATSSSNNTAFGYNTLGLAGYSNTAVGADALSYATYVNGVVPRDNVAIGHGAASYEMRGSRNIAVGRSALGSGYVMNGNDNIAIGYEAGLVSDEASGNIAIGKWTLVGSGGSLEASYNTVVGHEAGGLGDLSAENTLLGAYAGYYLFAGSGVPMSNNIGIGYNAQFANNIDSNQLSIGNLIFGVLPATTSTSSLYSEQTNPTFATGRIGIASSSPFAKLSVHANNGGTETTLFAIGSTSASGATSTLFTVSNVGAMSVAGAVQFASLGAGTLQTDSNGNVSVSSDERLKDIQGAYSRGLSAVLGIEPITYQWKKETGYDTENFYTGFSAQNIQEYIPEAVGEGKNGFLTLSDRPILAALVNAVKEMTKSFVTDRIETKMLCVEDVCVTRDEFKRMVETNATVSHGSSDSGDDADESGSTDTTEVVEQVPQDTASSTNTDSTTETSLVSDETAPEPSPASELTPEEDSVPTLNTEPLTGTSEGI